MLNDEDHLLKPVGLAYAVRPEDMHMLQFLNTFLRDFVRNREHITLRDHWFDLLAQARVRASGGRPGAGRPPLSRRATGTLMEPTRFAAGHVRNTRARPDRSYGPRQAAIIDRDGVAAARAEISGWPGYRPTPLVALDGLARRLDLGGVLYKDEDKRFGLHSFKALGGAYAVLCMLRERLAAAGRGDVSAGDLLAGRHREIVSGLAVACATDGNHGRSVAWGRRRSAAAAGSTCTRSSARSASTRSPATGR